MMQSRTDGNIPRNYEDLVHMLGDKEREVILYKKQIEQLQIKLAEYREKEDSLTDKPVSQKTGLLRAKSDPVCGQTSQNANAEIFLFPESQHADPSQHLISPPLSHLLTNNEPGSNAHSLTLSNKVGSENEPETSLQLRSNIPMSWVNPKIACQGYPGVSELYFKNVLNELMKTKKYLNNLLTQKNSTNPDETVELNNLREEIRQLMFMKQNLERELEEVSDVNTKLRKKCSTLKTSGQDNFAAENEISCFNQSTQTDNQIAVSQNLLRQYEYTVGQLVKENQGIKKELDELHSSQKNLSTQVFSLSTLLQEERKKNKSSEESLRNKTTEAKELSQKLCILRQKYEELMEEKNALEKNLALVGSIRRRSSQPHSGHGMVSYGRISSYDKPHQHPPFQGESNSIRNRSSPLQPHLPNLVHQNNLSPNVSEERKPLNIPAEYECPHCLRKDFDTEMNYHSHMAKCIE